ncbi:hypothetical protein GMORB2_3944 [Geosmithia morbida]|uniref:Uncharacterized protein n=1 Tax=Geosmithia morbida TaxID=1094350 RepID=A0A9P5D6T8_9HYPO|nr:uncharacterized protein GMORB2_3944 [Geosmithia morbida]KAF4125105.1 hypothetical protein GMORB2_3944 [Geosmithia morbida]
MPSCAVTFLSPFLICVTTLDPPYSPACRSQVHSSS